MIEPIQDYFVVSIERKYEDTKTKSGVQIVNAAYIDDGDMDRNEHKRIYGTVVSVPISYSKTPFRPIDDGMPSYRKFVGHDDIVDKMNRGYHNHTDKAYYPSTFDKYETMTLEDTAKNTDIQVGDKVYFMPQVTEPENFLEMRGKEFLYKVCVNEIFLAVVEVEPNKIRARAQGEWLLIRPNKETWEEITTPSGIIKKPNPENKWLEGIVVFSHHKHCKPGMKIAYLPNADCEVTIEGEKMFVMAIHEVMGELKQEIS